MLEGHTTSLASTHPDFLAAMPTTGLPLGVRPAWAALLDRFYAPAGLPLPGLERLRPEEVPPPYQGLLVHSADMTPTLEGFYGRPLGLTVMSREREEDAYLREVVLTLAAEKHPIEYGAIRIHLNRLPPDARRYVLEERRPLGKILETEAIPHLSWPQAFFRIESDARMSAALQVRQPAELYGRRNVLLDGSRHLLAEVIEVLAPVEHVYPRD
jgi:chorismate-pyruvate lyase